MKKLLSLSAVCFALALTPAPAFPIVCTNCSTVFVQMLERITNVQQLVTLKNQYTEALTQTAQQIELVRNAIQNTMQLPEQARGELTGQYASLANLTRQLKTQRGDFTALAQVFNTLYPEQSEFAKLSAASTPEEIEAANKRYRDYQDNWSKTVDESTQATYQLSGKQLEDLADAGELDAYIQGLLNTPEGQMQAAQAGNQLAALQVREARQLRELLATKAQSDLAEQEKKEKNDEWMAEQWRQATKTDMLKAPDRRDEPL